MLKTLAVANYRSLRRLVLPLGRLNVVSGANGSGKSNVYRALRLLAGCAHGGMIAALAREGGLQSTLWAGPENLSKAMRRGDVPVQGTVRQEPVNLRLGFAGDDFGYAIDLGLPIPGAPTLFGHDPQIKSECIWAGPLLRPASLLAERRNNVLRLRQGRTWQVVHQHLPGFDSLFAHCADPQAAPEVLRMRERIRGWRFYDQLRSDRDAAARQPQIGTHTQVLADDGADLAAALQTIREIGDPDRLQAALHDAFPGTQLQIDAHEGRLMLGLHQPGLLRPLRAAELSDGTLRYLLLLAALLSPRPPGLLVLNEPETSLHPDLLPALARLIAQAADQTQVLVVSHAARLVAALTAQSDCQAWVLEKEWSETRVHGLAALDEPAWYWLER
ncbi:AAA family ATPase [Chitiniphilus purpureus]|uniref:AAA family ATPase n=1 Tax=Chitiniphilus purpureus TaxID=2981137 RepID=A0ABY6DHE4_9NEIS|nr:AAA family ATPase [Chitiniphilus sp. CD1]UXY13762.1 AAA family ATPase [Chitiniphilus sp. CD1]